MYILKLFSYILASFFCVQGKLCNYLVFMQNINVCTRTVKSISFFCHKVCASKFIYLSSHIFWQFLYQRVAALITLF